MIQAQPVANLADNQRPDPQSAPNPPKPDQSQIEDFFNKLDDQLEKRHQTAWLTDYRNWLAILLAYQGYVIVPQSQGIGFELVPIQPNDPIYPLNRLRYYIDDVVNQWVQSNPLIDALALAETDDDRARATRVAKAEIDHYSRKFLTEEVRQEIAKLALFCGNYHACLYFDPMAPGPKRKVPVIAENQIPGVRSWSCADCGMAGIEPHTEEPHQTEIVETQSHNENNEAGEALHCQHCGSNRVIVNERPGYAVPTVAGHREENAGDFVFQLAPAWQLRFDRAVTADKSGWLRRSRDIAVEELQQLFPDEEIKATQPESEMTHPDRLMRKSLQAATRSGVYGIGEDDGHYAEFLEHWYEPSMYAKLVLTKDETLKDGTVLPAGTKFLDVYPNGCYRARIRGKHTLIMRGESHRDHWTHSRLIIVPGRGVGDNVKDAFEYYRQSNLLNTIRFTALRKAATPTLVVNRRMIRNSQLITKPGAVVGVEAQDIPEGRTIHDAFSAIPAMPATPDLDVYEERLQGGMQLSVKSLSMPGRGGGLPQLDNKTAYAVKAAEQKAEMARSGELALLGDFYKNIWAKLLKLSQKYLTDERLIQFTGKNGQLEPLSFRGADVACDFILWVRGTSYMPNSPLTRQANLQGAIETAGMLAGIGLTSPHTLRVINEIFDVELTGEDTNQYGDWCRLSINRLKEQLPQITPILNQLLVMPPQVQLDPATGMAAPVDPLAQAGAMLAQIIEIDPYELGAERKILWFRQWLTDDEGQKAHKVLRLAVHSLIDQLTEAIAMEQARRNQVAIAGQMPQIEMQQAVGAQQAEQQASTKGQKPPEKPPASKQGDGVPSRMDLARA